MTAETADIVLRGMDVRETEENFTHTCKICKKKFVSGRAFGGHMRIHGPVATAERLGASNELQKKRCRGSESVQEGGERGGFDPEDGSALYALRRHPKRSWRVSDREFSGLVDGSAAPLGNFHGCEACGKDFSSWRSLIAHTKCHSDPLWKAEDADEDWEYSQKFEGPEEEEEEEEEEVAADGESGNEIEPRRAADSGGFERWLKGKRSKRPRHAPRPAAAAAAAQDYQSCEEYSEEEEVAMWLVMLSGGGARKPEPRGSSGSKAPELKKKKKKKPEAAADVESGRAGYECATCNKVFHSHQALGGHRASHKKVKGCSSAGNESPPEGEIITEDEEHLVTASQGPAPRDVSSEQSYAVPAPAAAVGKARVHECSICHRVFPTGQALGGHKRCHWSVPGGGAAAAAASETTSTVSSTRGGKAELWDLNLPASADEDHCDAAAAALDSRRPPSSDDVESRGGFRPRCLPPPWWMAGYPPRRGLGLFLHVSPDDEVDSRPAAKLGFGRAQISDLQAAGPQPWLLA